MRNKAEKKRRMLKKDILLLQLAKVGEVTLETLFGIVGDIGGLALEMANATSKSESVRNMERYMKNRGGVNFDFQSKVALSMMVSRLAKEGLLSRKDGKISITEKGKKVSKLSDDTRLKKMPDGRSILVVFDIPECFSGKRKWIRSELRMMEFELVQKSVWRGNVMIPESFLRDLENVKIRKYVHIFEITKYGTLEN